MLAVILGSAALSPTGLFGRELGHWLLAVLVATVVAVCLNVACRRWNIAHRQSMIMLGAAIGMVSVGLTTQQPFEVFDYAPRQSRGEIRAVHTLIPHSPNQRFPSLDRVAPLTVAEPEPVPGRSAPSRQFFLLGTDGLGQDVLSQLLWASRLAISIGLVSAGIAAFIGIALGAVMGYFGGWIDLLLFRVVEVFMSIPLLFLLIVAAGVLPHRSARPTR
jgi:ABC-type dipeptide/oligopeptide/nickel transport system permease subunit